MKIYQVTARYESAFNTHNAEYLLAAEDEGQARKAAEEEIGEKKPYLLNSVGLTVVEIFDKDRLEERLERLERTVANLEKKETGNEESH